MNTVINDNKEDYYSDSESESESSHITLNSDKKFQSWEEFEAYLDQYVLQEGFAYKKTRVEYHLSHNEMKNLIVEEKTHYIKRRTYECSHSRHHISKKFVDLESQQNRESHQIDCPWRVNVTKPKKENSIGVTSVNHDHNHNMNPLVELRTGRVGSGYLTNPNRYFFFRSGRVG